MDVSKDQIENVKSKIKNTVVKQMGDLFGCDLIVDNADSVQLDVGVLTCREGHQITSIFAPLLQARSTVEPNRTKQTSGQVCQLVF
jgi:hypothetical protein